MFSRDEIMWDNENIFCHWKFGSYDIHSLWKKAVNFKGYQAHSVFLNFCTCGLIFGENFIWLRAKKPLVVSVWVDGDLERGSSSRLCLIYLRNHHLADNRKVFAFLHLTKYHLNEAGNLSKHGSKETERPKVIRCSD